MLFQNDLLTGHAKELGIHPARIAIAGESGGGYICFGTMVLLGKPKVTVAQDFKIYFFHGPLRPLQNGMCSS